MPDFFGIIAFLENRKVKVRDLPEFSDWLHVISNLVIIRVFGGSDTDQRDGLMLVLVNTL